MILALVLLILVWWLPVNGAPVHEQRPQSQLLKFIAALIVVLGHETMFYCDVPQMVVAETNYGNLCVAFFLFMSGYGLLYGYHKKGRRDLSYSWLGKRLLKLIVPAMTAMAFYLTVKVCSGRTVDWGGVVKYWFVSNGNLIYGWYVSEIICLYVAFFLCYRWVCSKYALAILTGTIGIAMLVMIILKQPVWYIQGLPCFVLGLFLANYDFVRKSDKVSGSWHLRMLMTLTVIGFFILKHFEMVQQMIPVLNKWRYMYVSFFVGTPLFIVIIAYILMRLPVCKRMLNRGGDFYEVYLVQGAALLVCRDLITQDILFIPVGLIITVLVAKGMNKINGRRIKVLS